MSSQASIAIADGAATPVTHTFAGATASNDIAVWEDRVSGQYIGYNRLRFELQRPKGPSNQANRNLRLMIRLETPVLETLGTSDSGFTPPPTVAFRPQAELTFTLPERSTLQQRRDLHTLMKNLFSSAALVNAVEIYDIPS